MVSGKENGSTSTSAPQAAEAGTGPDTTARLDACQAAKFAVGQAEAFPDWKGLEVQRE